MPEAVRGEPNSVDIDHASKQVSQMRPIHLEDVVGRLDLAELPKSILHSVRGSIWGEIGTGTTILECRTVSILQQPRCGGVVVIDFDDCMMSATGWHRNEYELLAQNEELRQTGIAISTERAKAIYEMSKMRIPGTVVKEPRYTPRLNLVLLSIYGEEMRKGAIAERPEEDVWNDLVATRKTIDQQVQEIGEQAISYYMIHPLIKKIFMGNPPSKFLYGEFVQDVLDATSPNDIRVIATRGKIKGPLGQIHKIHASGLMRQRNLAGQGIDLVIYSNDLKADALIAMTNILPEIGKRLIRVYDDNPEEILPYLEMTRRLGTQNIEVIQVSHPDAKRKEASLGAVEPRLDYSSRDTRLRHYSSSNALVSAAS